MVIVASDKFKGTFSAEEICELVCGRLSTVYPGQEIVSLPMADGGEGTARVIASRLGLPEMETEGENPFGAPIRWKYYSDGRTAAIDSASVVGLVAVGGVVAPLEASSYPLGDLMAKLAADGVGEIHVGVGGTMTTDGGAGLLQALGWRFFDKNGRAMSRPLTPRLLLSVGEVRPPQHPLRVGIRAFMDVDVPLVIAGDDGAGGLSALSFAPQKGVAKEELEVVRSGLENFVNVVSRGGGVRSLPDRYCGAGGGLGFSLQLVGATPLSGASSLWDAAIADNRLDMRNVTRIYTGEGCFDEQSMAGKVTGTIIRFARPLGIPVTVVCGRCDMSASEIPDGTEVILLSEFLNKPC